MAQVNIVYRHSAEPVPPAGAEIRRKSIAEMESYMESLVVDMKIAGVSTKFESVSGDGPNDVIVNGKSVRQILDGLEIKRPEIYDDSPKIIQFERAPEDWHMDCIEDISDILMKNALSKAFADSEGLRVKEFMASPE
jgi:hypothetical protein